MHTAHLSAGRLRDGKIDSTAPTNMKIVLRRPSLPRADTHRGVTSPRLDSESPGTRLATLGELSAAVGVDFTVDINPSGVQLSKTA